MTVAAHQASWSDVGPLAILGGVVFVVGIVAFLVVGTYVGTVLVAGARYRYGRSLHRPGETVGLQLCLYYLLKPANWFWTRREQRRAARARRRSGMLTVVARVLFWMFHLGLFGLLVGVGIAVGGGPGAGIGFFLFIGLVTIGAALKAVVRFCADRISGARTIARTGAPDDETRVGQPPRAAPWDTTA